MIRKIAVTGPESTGKSDISAKLARHYNTVWVPEYARNYLCKLNRDYRQDDLHAIALGQMQSEKETLPSARRFLFTDTEMTVIKVWSVVKFGVCDPQILEFQHKQNYGLYLLMDIDIPWEYDPLREHPHLRQDIFSLYLDEMKRMNYPFEIISGSGDERLKNAIAAVERHFPADEQDFLSLYANIPL